MNRSLIPLLLTVAVVLPTPALSNERGMGLADVVLRLQQLETEVQRLRGEVELQKHAIDALNRRQRDLYMDLDSRLSGGAAPAAGQTAPPQPPPVHAASPAPAPMAPPVESAPAPTPAPAPVAATAAGDPTHEKEEYQNAFGLLKDGRYSESIAAFRSFLAKYPNGNYADNALYWMGEASYVNRDFATALGDFEQLLQQHPSSPKVPGAMLKIGYVHYEQHDWGQARSMLNRLQKEYPGSTEAQLADQRLSRMRREGH